ncbi:MAG: hypothetical protein IBV52_10155 [Candidatus Bathyarchaeota archaeon]
MALRYGAESKLDLLTIDGALGGTGMSPWRMMNEWGIPSVEIWSLTYQYADRLAKKGEYLPSIAFAGGITLEDHIFKALALGSPYVKAVGMARAPLTAAMVSKNVGQRITGENLPIYYGRYGNTVEAVFVEASRLKRKLGKNFEELPTGAMGLYTYNQRLTQGLKQLMCGARKFALQHITRDDIVALTTEAARASGIKYVMDVDKEEVEKILG